MTANRRVKLKTRAYAAEHGISYTAALRKVQEMSETAEERARRIADQIQGSTSGGTQNNPVEPVRDREDNHDN